MQMSLLKEETEINGDNDLENLNSAQYARYCEIYSHHIISY